jgi:hypothetical protein
MTIIWFNGPSRQRLIDKFQLQPTEIGCNFIRQDRAVQHVCVFDRSLWPKITHEQSVRYYTNIAWAKSPWDSAQHGWAHASNSGTLAVVVARRLSVEPIYIIGCDWGLNQESVYDYQKTSQRKYSNSCKTVLNVIHKEAKITVVHDLRPDVDQPIMSTDQFLDLILNK